MNRITLFNRSSSTLFGLGVLASFVGYLPNPILAAAGKLFSLLCYFLAYLTWYLVSKLYPSHPDLEKIAFDLNQFKSQNRLSAFIGLLGVLIAAIAFVFPVLMIPASWIFALSTACWVLSQVHKLFNPIPGDEEFSPERHKIYIVYATTLLAMGLLTAIATTLIFTMPVLAPTIMIVSAVIFLYLLATSLFLLVEYLKPEQIDNKQSYATMLGGDLTPGQACDLSPALEDTKAAITTSKSVISPSEPTQNREAEDTVQLTMTCDAHNDKESYSFQ